MFPDLPLDPEDEVECDDCGDVIPTHYAKKLDDRWLCPWCFPRYNPDL